MGAVAILAQAVHLKALCAGLAIFAYIAIENDFLSNMAMGDRNMGGGLRSTDPFTGTQPRANCTSCPSGVWCSGRIPTHVLAHKLSKGESPLCRYCAKPFKLPGFQGGKGKGTGGKGKGKGKVEATGPSPFAATGPSPFLNTKEVELQKQLKAAQDLLTENKIPLPPTVENKNKYDVAEHEIIAAFEICKKLGTINPELQQKYDEIQNRHKQTNEIKSSAVLEQQLQKAQRQLEKCKKDHAKLLVWLHNNTVTGAKLCAEIDEINKQKAELLDKQGFQPKAEAQLLQQPQNMSEGQIQKWEEVSKRFELEMQQEREKCKEKYNAELQKLQQVFEEDVKNREKEGAKKSASADLTEGSTCKKGEDEAAEKGPESGAVPMEEEDANAMQQEFDEVQKSIIENMHKHNEKEEQGPHKRIKLPEELGKYARTFVAAANKASKKAAEDVTMES